MSPMKKLPFSTLRRIPLGSIRGSENSYRKKKKKKIVKKTERRGIKKTYGPRAFGGWPFLYLLREKDWREHWHARVQPALYRKRRFTYIYTYTHDIYTDIYILCIRTGSYMCIMRTGTRTNN